MDFTELFASFARYLDYSIDLGGFVGLEQFAKTNAINTDLATYFIFGLSLAYLIARASAVPNYERLPEGKSETELASKAKNDSQRVILQAFMFVGGGLFFHLFLGLFFQITGQNYQLNVKDTVNGILAYQAFYAPLNALVTRLWKSENIKLLLQFFGSKSRLLLIGCSILIVIGTILGVGFYVYSLVLYIYVFAAVHQIPNDAFVAPVITIIVLFLPLIIWLVKERRSLDQETVVGEATAIEEVRPSLDNPPHN
jgi:hypothetical protein